MDINIDIATKSDSTLFLKVFINDFTEVELNYRDLETWSQTEIQPLKSFYIMQYTSIFQGILALSSLSQVCSYIYINILTLYKEKLTKKSLSVTSNIWNIHLKRQRSSTNGYFIIRRVI